jgi:hypothetical protein
MATHNPITLDHSDQFVISDWWSKYMCWCHFLFCRLHTLVQCKLWSLWSLSGVIWLVWIGVAVMRETYHLAISEGLWFLLSDSLSRLGAKKGGDEQCSQCPHARGWTFLFRDCACSCTGGVQNCSHVRYSAYSSWYISPSMKLVDDHNKLCTLSLTHTADKDDYCTYLWQSDWLSVGRTGASNNSIE